MKRNLYEDFIRLLRGAPPTQTEEFFHQKRLNSFNFSIKRISVFSIIALVLTSIIIFFNSDNYPDGNTLKPILLAGASILVLLLCAPLQSLLVKKLLTKAWDWRNKN